MYVEKIDLGEGEPRTVVSGLVGKIDMEELEGRLVVCVCNLKPANLRSIKSFAMLLCATGDKTECLDPPEKCVVGDVVTVEGFGAAPDDNIKPGSSKKGPSIWEQCQPGLGVDDNLVAQYHGLNLMTPHGPLTVKTVKGAAIR